MRLLHAIAACDAQIVKRNASNLPALLMQVDGFHALSDA
jgi:hypothetical protein